MQDKLESFEEARKDEGLLEQPDDKDRIPPHSEKDKKSERPFWEKLFRMRRGVYGDYSNRICQPNDGGPGLNGFFANPRQRQEQDKRLEKGKKLYELMGAKQEALKRQVKEKFQMKKTINETVKTVEKYRNMAFPQLLKDYLNTYFEVYICGQISAGVSQLLNIIELEVFGFRSKGEQEEFIQKVRKLNQVTRNADLRALGI